MEHPYRPRTRQTPTKTPSLANDSELISNPVDAESYPTGPNVDSAAFEVIEDSDTLRLRHVLAMRMEGQTQKEIAAHFGRDERTIRRWIHEAK